MPYYQLVRTMQYTETAYVEASSQEEADEMFCECDIFVENHDYSAYDQVSHEISEQEFEENQ